MIKKFLATIILATGLTGCAPGSLGLLGLSSSQIALIDQVQAGAVKLCGVMPVIESVVAIMAGPVGNAVGAVTNAFCSAVPAIPLSAGQGAVATTAGQPVSGVVGNIAVSGVRVR